MLRLAASRLASLAPLEYYHEVAGFVSVVAALNLDIVGVDALHLLAIRCQKVDLLLCHWEEHMFFVVLLFLADIVSLARAGFDLYEVKAFSFIIESPLLEVELDLANGRFLD